MPEFVEVEVAVDSGAVIHVMDRLDAPYHEVVPSAGSKKGQYFVAANNEHIMNEGKITAEMRVPQGDGKEGGIGCDFQIAKVSRPLMTMSKICDQGLQVLTNKECAKVIDSNGKVIARFERVGGLYVAKMKMRNPRYKPKPSPFAGQGKR